jgi:glycosyltransferase involved in cell wall biosynthesis
MKVALIVPGGVDPSGTHRVIPCLLWLIERLSREHDVHVFAMRGAAAGRRYALLGACIHQLGGTRRRALPTLAALVREHRRGAFDVLHACWVSGPGLVAAAAGRLLGRPVLLHIPGGDLVALPEIGYGGRRTRAERARVRLALAGAEHRTAPSAAICEAATALGYATERLPLGVSRGAWPPQPPRPRTPGAPLRLVHVASINQVKDPFTLLRAAGRLAGHGLEFTLDVVGADTLGGAAQRLAAELALGGRVRFHGFLPQESLRPLVTAADLMLVTSRHEAGPVAAVEAAMVGVPTVGTAVGILPEWAPHAARVVPVGHDADLAAAVLDLAACDERRLAVAHAALRRALAEDADWSARRVGALYRDLAARRSGRRPGRTPA